MSEIGWLFEDGTDRIFADTTLEEADVLYAGNVDTETRRNITGELVERDLDVTDLAPGDIEEIDGELYIDGVHASALRDKTVFYRQKMFLAGLEDEEKAEKLGQVQALEEDYGLDFINSSHGATVCDDKQATKDVLEDAYAEVDGVDVPDTYTSMDDIAQLDEEETVVKKTREGSCGNGVEFLEAGEVEDFEEDVFYEEFVDHYTEGKDMRGFVIDGKPVGFAERTLESDEIEPKNLANDGHYRESGEVNWNEVYAVREASDALDVDVAAVDYVKQDDGSVKVLEVNATPGTKIDDLLDNNLYGEIADHIEDSTRKSMYRADAPGRAAV